MHFVATCSSSCAARAANLCGGAVRVHTHTMQLYQINQSNPTSSVTILTAWAACVLLERQRQVAHRLSPVSRHSSPRLYSIDSVQRDDVRPVQLTLGAASKVSP